MKVKLKRRKKTKKIHKVCLVCGESFKTSIYRIEENNGKYCNRICMGKARTGEKHHGWGKEMSKEQRIKLSISKMGEKNPSWKGGISNNPYPKEFTDKLKFKIRQRDNFTCCLCGVTEREQLEELNRVLCVNHIDFNKNNCFESNLNTLCIRCNVKINRDREYWTNYFNS